MRRQLQDAGLNFIQEELQPDSVYYCLLNRAVPPLRVAAAYCSFMIANKSVHLNKYP